MNKKLNQYLKLFAAIVFSFVLSSFLIKDAFIARSPKINKFFFANMKNRVKNFASNNWSNLVAFLRNKPNQGPDEQKKAAIAILNETLKPVTKGVKASSYENYRKAEYTLDEIEWVEITIPADNGTEMKIRVPKGAEHLYR